MPRAWRRRRFHYAPGNIPDVRPGPTFLNTSTDSEMGNFFKVSIEIGAGQLRTAGAAG